MDNKPNFTKKTNMQIQHLMDVILALRFSDLDEDYNACAKLLEISEKENYTYGIAFAYAYMGDCLIGKNESINASTKLMRAKELCEKNRYLDLLPYVCTWLGIYYEMQNDRQMAMHCYLDALEFAERNHDLMRQSILLNNIASQFHNCSNYEVAKEYYVKALNCYNLLEHSNISDPHYAQMTTNIISVCCRMKQIDDAKHYFSLLKQSKQGAKNQDQLYLCELLIAAATSDIKATHTSVDKLLLEMQKEPKDLHHFFEMFLVVAESMIVLKEAEHARKILTVLNDMCKEDDYGRRLKVQYVWMRFYIIFGTLKEKNKAYREFYELRQLSDETLNQNLADGLLSKIKLRESVKKTQEIEKAKAELEGALQLDELTQLYNRRSLRQLTEQVANDPQVKMLGFIMIDVDYFKQYNDTYGHSKGDDALRAVAKSLLAAADKDIFSFRYGGDEFVSMCKNKAIEEIESYIEAFTNSLRQKHIPHIKSLCSQQLTLSIGYNLRERQGNATMDAAEVLAEADRALYQAKDLGRNGHCRYIDANNSASVLRPDFRTDKANDNEAKDKIM